MTDTMTMLEKVAGTLYAFDYRDESNAAERWLHILSKPTAIHSGDCTNESHSCLVCQRDEYLARASTALESLLDPSPEMVEAMMMGYLNAPREAREEFSDSMSIAIYRAAITTALNTGENPSDANPKSR